MNKETVYWIEYHVPGIMFGESFSTKLLTQKPKPGRQAIKWPSNAYAFTIWRREDVVENGKRYKGEAKVVGKRFRYHPKSKITTLSQIKAGEAPSKNNGTLIRNMEVNKWKGVIWTRWGNWPQPWRPKEMEILSSS